MRKGTIALLGGALGVVGGAIIGFILSGKSMEETTKKVDKYKSYYNVLNQWLILKEEGKSIENYFINKGYKKIAIYGMGEMGNRLFEELENSSIEVAYGIDKNAFSSYSELQVVSIDDNLELVDAIIVTAIFDFYRIEELLGKKIECPVVSLEEVVFEV